MVIITSLGLLFVVGGFFAAAAAITGSDPTEVLVPDPAGGLGSTTATITAISVDAAAGDMRVRINIAPAADLVSGGDLIEDLTLVVNDAGGPNSRRLRAGDPVQPFVVTVPLTDGVIAQYPFDSYRAIAILRITRESDEGAAVPLSAGVSSSVAGFGMTAGPAEGTSLLDTDIAVVEFRIERRWAPFVYALGVMAIMLALAITALRIIWATYVWHVVSPPWLYGFFIGALFALPPLRSSLPGAPPPGAIVDFISFYPSVSAVAVAMLVVLSHWLSGIKPRPDE